MNSKILVVGGGLSGLTATWQLRAAGVDAILLEGRSRLGGRVLTVGRDRGANCDLGPSWFWNGQPLIATLLDHFDIPYYEQFAEGAVLFEPPHGPIETYPGPSPMAGARRIEGGVGRLVDAIAAQIEPNRRLLNHRVNALSLNDNEIIVEGLTPAGPFRARGQQVALAMPPRLVAGLTLEPLLPDAARETLAATPTWMAGHAKFFAVYEEPFWRTAGLCGSAISRRGPLAEIHDASPANAPPYCLFGFLGLAAADRAHLGNEEISRRAITQLITLFGEAAGRPKAAYFQDWSSRPLTAGPADQHPQTRHFEYGLDVDPGAAWTGKLELISTESSPVNGGLIEGALEAAVRFAGLNLPRLSEIIISHTASMGWDWLSHEPDSPL